jgi:hypothetical protein
LSFVKSTLERRVIPHARRVASDASSWITGGKELGTQPTRIRDYIGAIRLNDQIVPMRFSYWKSKESAEELVRRDEWQSLKRVLGETKNIAN